VKITVLGVIAALKNVGLFLASYQVTGITANPMQFVYSLLIFACVSIPSDLYLLNKAHNNVKAEESQKEVK